MLMPTAALGNSRTGLAALRHGAVVLAVALLFGPGAPPQAAPAEPASQASSPQPSQALRTQVVSLLEQPDALPPYGARWQPLGPGALGVLQELASNPKIPAAQRARAVTSMAAVDHPQAADHLRVLLEDASTAPPLRASAVIALSLRAGTEAIPTLLPFLQAPDDQVRIAAARALGRLGGAQVQQALEERLPFEREPLVREALQQGLTFLVP
ncbi:HEAT repeat domain-containing protein [Hyalangium sp.]|uniref:HEAT repeat domain-containing protein n=1 Tax=Hyalangium sp. TaxID=2028555 RepID=UPI002D2F0621|nr:HEAT repeat domain-containing protein [Hyalangium sp.]HYI00718.1 HEAT repeat domain-containing protein [Hyalangium sp.]